MRISIVEGDRGYREPPVPVDVYLDGDKQEYVRWADEEAGELERCVLDAEGRIQVDPNNPDEIWTEVVKGSVRIEWWGEKSD